MYRPIFESERSSSQRSKVKGFENICVVGSTTPPKGDVDAKRFACEDTCKMKMQMQMQIQIQIQIMVQSLPTLPRSFPRFFFPL